MKLFKMKNLTAYERVTYLFRKLGVLPNIQGYEYAMSAIMLVYEDNTLLRAITKELYPLIAKQYNTTPNKVERAIRHMIEKIWSSSGNVRIFKDLFGYVVNKKKRKPTNSEFISLIVDDLLLVDKIETDKINPRQNNIAL